MSDLQGESGASPDALAPDASPSLLRVVAVVVIVLSLMVVAIGALLGVLEYNSPSGREMRALNEAASGALNGTLPDGVVVTGAPYTTPGVGEAILGQAPTWLGVVGVVIGLMLLMMSSSNASGPTDERPAPSPSETWPNPGCDVDGSSPFDTGD